MSQGEAGKRSSAFVEEAAGRRSGLLAELVEFLRSNKKWWLMPIVLALLAMAVLIVLSSTAAAPFIYTLF
jgi:hypothetical protein